MKAYIVSCIDRDCETSEILALFSTNEKAELFIEVCKHKFRSNGVFYDYRRDELTIDEWDMDEFNDIKMD